MLTPVLIALFWLGVSGWNSRHPPSLQVPDCQAFVNAFADKGGCYTVCRDSQDVSQQRRHEAAVNHDALTRDVACLPRA